MSTNLILISILFITIVIFMILYFIRKDKIKVKYSIIWLLLFALILICLLIPGFLVFLTNLLGFKTPSNMIISMLLAVLVIISISLTGIVSSQDKKIRLLIQEISVLKKDIGDSNGKR